MSNVDDPCSKGCRFEFQVVLFVYCNDCCELTVTRKQVIGNKIYIRSSNPAARSVSLDMKLRLLIESHFL